MPDPAIQPPSAAPVLAESSQGWTPIHRWTDAAPFAGRVVAFRARGTYYTHSVHRTGPDLVCDASGLSPRPADGVGFALVHRRHSDWTTGPGWGMDRLKTVETCAAACALSDAQLQGARLDMRVATDEELDAIAEALRGGGSGFEYVETGEAMGQIQGCCPRIGGNA